MDQVDLDPVQSLGKMNIRLLNGPQDRASASILLDQCFGLSEGQRFLDDFPIWDSELASTTERWGVFAGERLIGSAGIRHAELKTLAEGKIRVGLLGGVVTDPAFQGRGIASILVNHALQSALQRHAAVVLLWGSQHALYRKAGFELCGEQIRLPLKNLSLDEKPILMKEAYGPQIFEIMKERPTGLSISEMDRAWIESHRHVKWWTTIDPKDPFAYLAYERGIDLGGIIHEWGGDAASIRGLFAGLRENHPHAEILGSISRFKELEIQSPQNGGSEYLCMAKILDPMAVLAAYRIHKPSLLVSRHGTGWRVQSGTSEGKALTDSQLVRLFFGPRSEEESKLWSNRPGIELWVWGLDAV